jgi:acetyl-CoA synthetase
MIPHLEKYQSYEQAREEFRLEAPEPFNIAEAICSRHEDAATRVALIECRRAGNNTYTFGAISFFSDKFASVLLSRGIGPGDRIAVALRQSAALTIAHLGALKIGATVVPLPPFVEQTALEFALKNSSAKAIVIDPLALKQSRAFTGSLPSVESVFVTGDESDELKVEAGELSFWGEVYAAPSDVQAAKTSATTPAYIFYSPELESPGPGVVHGHGLLVSNLPAFEMLNNLDIGPESVFYSLGNWSTLNSLIGMLFPAWLYGRPVVAGAAWIFVHPDMFDLFERCSVTNLYVEPDEMDNLIGEASDPWSEYDLKIRNLCSFSAPHLPWTRASFSASANRAVGTLETGFVLSSCERWFPHHTQSLGRAVPGRTVEIVDESGRLLPAGQAGHIAVERTDDSLFIEYLDEKKQSQKPFSGDWFLTGQTGLKDEEGYFWPAPIAQE